MRLTDQLPAPWLAPDPGTRETTPLSEDRQMLIVKAAKFGVEPRMRPYEPELVPAMMESMARPNASYAQTRDHARFACTSSSRIAAQEGSWSGGCSQYAAKVKVTDPVLQPRYPRPQQHRRPAGQVSSGSEIITKSDRSWAWKALQPELFDQL